MLEGLPPSGFESLIIISKYQKYANHLQVYSPFYLTYMFDISDKKLLLGPCEDALDKRSPTHAVESKMLLTLSGFKGEQ